MRVVRIENPDKMFGAPSDWKDDGSVCAVLPVRVVDTPQGRFMVSAWEPTVEDIRKMMDGETIKLWIRCEQHPVVSMTVGEI